jgi:hypothetical protein
VSGFAAGSYGSTDRYATKIRSKTGCRSTLAAGGERVSH